VAHPIMNSPAKITVKPVFIIPIMVEASKKRKYLFQP